MCRLVLVVDPPMDFRDPPRWIARCEDESDNDPRWASWCLDDASAMAVRGFHSTLAEPIDARLSVTRPQCPLVASALHRFDGRTEDLATKVSIVFAAGWGLHPAMPELENLSMQRMTVVQPKRVVMLWSAALALSASLSPVSAQQAITTPIPTTDQNFRDLAGISENAGGSGFVDPTTHGGAMRTGVFYRSEALTTLSTTDWRTLSSLRIGLDVDVRTPSEIDGPTSITAPNAGHDWLPAGARYINDNIYVTYAPPSSASVATPGEASAYLIATYQNFVSDATERGGFRSALLALAGEPSAALFHCAAGQRKDARRTPIGGGQN